MAVIKALVQAVRALDSSHDRRVEGRGPSAPGERRASLHRLSGPSDPQRGGQAGTGRSDLVVCRVQAKNIRAAKMEAGICGDVWTFAAIEAQSKLVNLLDGRTEGRRVCDGVSSGRSRALV